MTTTFALLAISICAVWLPTIQIGARFNIAPWAPIFIGAIASGLVTGYITVMAIVSLGMLGALAYLTQRSEASRLQKIVFGVFTALLALALAIHRLPGFNNPILVENIRFSGDAAPFTQYANFDKAAVGLILLAFLCKRAGTVSDWREVLRRTAPIALITTVIVIVTAVASGFVRPEFKLSSFTPTFLATNLLFTCVAEETFFRGFLQDRLAPSLDRIRFGGPIAIFCSGILFGLTHVGGGMNYALLATLVGIGSAYAYSATQRIEAPIMTHFTLNAVHFIGFTYPHLQ